MKKKHIPSTSKHTQDQEPTTNDHQLSLVTQDHETLLTKCFIGKSIIGGPSWLGLMKKAFRSPTKERDIKSIRRREEAHEQEEEEKRGKRRWVFRKPTCHETTLIHKNQDQADVATSKITSKGNLATIFLPENADHSKQKRTIAVTIFVDITGLTQPPIIVKQQRAILIIQTAFRGYLARKALGALKGLVKLQALIRGHNVRKRAKITLQCMQSLVRVQTQICDERRRLSCERINCGSMMKEPKSILELHLSDKESTHSTKQASNEEDGYDHLHALKKVEVLLQKAKEAAKKRENTLAHAFSEKMWNSNKDEVELEEDLRVFHCKRMSRGSCDQPRDHIEIETACSYSDPDTEFWRLHHQYYHEQQQKFYSSFAVPSPSPLSHSLPMTPPFKMKNILVHSASPRCKKEYKTNDNSFYAADQPNYMTATASAKARERQIPTTPQREKIRTTKKRLSFPGQ